MKSRPAVHRCSDVRAGKTSIVLTTFDRYLLKRFFYAFLVCFLGTLGVFFVFDAFTNADEFLKVSPEGEVWPIAKRMGVYYAGQAILFLGTAGHVLCVLAVMVVLSMVQRTGELHPLLAAGVPLYRVVMPLVLGVVMVNAAMIANQECLLPRIAPMLQAPRGRHVEYGVNVRPTRDFATHVLISAKRLFPASSRLENAEFVLPVPDIVARLTTLKAKRARFLVDGPDGQSGWLLGGLTPAPDELSLTGPGRHVVRVGARRRTIFVVSGVTPDQLSDKADTGRFLSTPDLYRRVRNPSQATRSAHGQVLALHARLTRPLLNVCAVFLVVPFLVRREGCGLVANLAVGAAAMLVTLGLGETCFYLASIHVISADVAAWSPILACGTFATWCAPNVET